MEVIKNSILLAKMLVAGLRILCTHFDIIDSLAKIEAVRIKQDPVASVGMVAEGMEGKKIIYNCMQFMNGKELNRIARSRFRSEVKTVKR